MAQQIVFSAPNVVELREFTFDLTLIKSSQVAIQTHISLISPGTELACLRGTESWARPPFVPGYAGCGTVIAVGAAVTDVVVGDTVFSHTRHASHVLSSNVIVKIPPGMDLKRAVFARMGSVSMTALRASAAELGDTVAIIGLGLVGNLAGQLFALAGCDVIGIDLSAQRCALAEKCGIQTVIQGSIEEALPIIDDLTHGHRCEVVVEAIGLPQLGATAGQLAGKLGEVILLGSPRGELQGNVTELLNEIHLWGNGCVTYKGAHEWRYPLLRDPNGWTKHSIERNTEILLDLIARGRLHVDDLLTHIVPPTEAPSAYAGLRDLKDEYLGVVFDWGGIE